MAKPVKAGDAKLQGLNHYGMTASCNLLTEILSLVEGYLCFFIGRLKKKRPGSCGGVQTCYNVSELLLQ